MGLCVEAVFGGDLANLGKVTVSLEAESKVGFAGPTHEEEASQAVRHE